MQDCSATASEEAKNWPEGTISVRVTMNPYVFAMAIEQAYRQGMKPWEFINSAMWEKIGRPSHKELLENAASLELDDADPKWKKRLIITARHEIETAAAMMEKAAAESKASVESDDGDGAD